MKQWFSLAQILSLKSVLRVLGIGLMAAWALSSFSKRKSFQKWQMKLRSFVEERFSRMVFGLTFTFFVLASVAKFSQFNSLSLHALDFWLFEDILRQSAQGGFFLTRFAPQAEGWVQHGVIHAMFTWAGLIPFGEVIGYTSVCLLFEPLVFALSGALLAFLSKDKWGKEGAFGVAGGFLLSSQVARILMYDVHPEALYPLCLFALIWSLTHSKWVFALLALVAGIGIKEDSLFVFFPALMWASFVFRGRQRQGSMALLGIGLLVYGLELSIQSRWASGSLGPTIWNALPVRVPQGIGFFHGIHWDSPSHVIEIVQRTAESQGGMLGLLQSLLRFLFSKPWISLLLVAPWVVKEAKFWWMVLPLALPYSLFEGPSKFLNYYSAPFLGIFWLIVAISPLPKKGRTFAKVWVLAAALLLGGNSIEFYFPTSQQKQVVSEAKQFAQCLLQGGLVAPPLIPLVPQEKIYTYRVPRVQEDWKHIQFVYFIPGLPTYEIPESDIQFLLALQKTGEWEEVDQNCEKVLSSVPSTRLSRVWVRKEDF